MAENADLIIKLSHELGVALELHYDGTELRELWPDAVDALKDTRQYLVNNGLPVPPVIENVIKTSEQTT